MDTKVKIELESQQALTSIKDLQKALKAAKDEMVGLEPGSEAFLEAAKKAGELKHQVDEIRQAVQGASTDFGDMVGNVAKAGAGITGAFQAAQGAMNLFGIESENVTEAIAKMQNLMAITQGLASIDQGIKAFGKLKTAIGLSTTSLSGFKKALIGTGLGAFVILVGELVAHWDDLCAALEKYGIIAKDTTAQEKALAAAMEDHAKALHQLEDDYEAWKTRNKLADMNETARKSYEKLTMQIEDYTYQYNILAEKQQSKKLSRDEYEAITAQAQGLQHNINLLKQQQRAILDNAASYVKETKKEAKATKENKENPERLVLDALSEQAKVRKQLQEQNLAEAQKIVEDKKTEIQLINEQIDRLKIAMSIDFENRKVYSEAILSLEEQRHQIVMKNQLEEAEAVRTAEQERLEQYSIAFSEFANNLDEMTDNPAWGKMVDHVINLTDRWDVLSQEIKVGGEKSAKAYLQIFSQAFAGIGQMLTGLANEQDASSRKGFETQKKMQIAATTMNMLSGIASAWSSAMQLGPIAGPIVGAVLTAATSALGGVQIAKIKQTKFDGGSVSGGAANAALTASALAAAQPVQYTQDVQGASIEETIKDQRVYVTESDISNTQRKVDVAESENRF